MCLQPANLSKSEADIEDLLPADAYIAAFNSAYSKELGEATLTIDELGTHPRMVERINQWLQQKGITLLKDGGFNHYRVAQAVLSELTAATLRAEDLKRFERLFDRVSGAL